MKKSLRLPLRIKDPFLEKFHFFFIWFVRITFLIAIYRALFTGNWHVFVVSLVALALTFLAYIIEKYYAIDIPIEFEIGIVFLLYGSIFLGELRGYYSSFWWWDLTLHVLTGIIVALVGFLMLLILYKRKRVEAAPFFIALFSFSLAAAIGGIWEIFEFGMDQLFGLNMQKSGLVDTMWDIIVNDAGALLVSITGYLYLKSGQAPLLGNIIRRFRKENPHIQITKPQPKK